MATIALICKYVHYDIAYGRGMNEVERFRMKHPELSDAMTEAGQSTNEEVDTDQPNGNNNSSNSSSTNHGDGRPHEASAQQNNNYLEPGD